MLSIKQRETKKVHHNQSFQEIQWFCRGSFGFVANDPFCSRRPKQNSLVDATERMFENWANGKLPWRSICHNLCINDMSALNGHSQSAFMGMKQRQATEQMHETRKGKKVKPEWACVSRRDGVSIRLLEGDQNTFRTSPLLLCSLQGHCELKQATAHHSHLDIHKAHLAFSPQFRTQFSLHTQSHRVVSGKGFFWASKTNLYFAGR